MKNVNTMSSIVNHELNKLTNRHNVDTYSKCQTMSIDCLPIRTGVRSIYKYHNVNSLSRKSKHLHLVDTYDNAKILSSMARRECKPCVNQPCKQWYQIIVNNGEYTCKVKESHVLSKCQALREKGIEFTVRPM